eukprot:gene44231-59897_t
MSLEVRLASSNAMRRQQGNATGEIMSEVTAPTPPLTILLAAPRGFCAGVDRAIQIVVLALKKYGAPVYVRHEIVHNRYVVEGLQSLGAVFIEELSEIPAEHRQSPVVFSAHG